MTWAIRRKVVVQKRALSGRGTHIGLFHRFTSLDCFLPGGRLLLLLLLLITSISMLARLTLAAVVP